MRWYAIYTKPRNEDIIAYRLQVIGIEVLNPKMKLKKYQRNKLSEVIEPLFPCYLFAHFDSKYFHMISFTRGVKYIVGKSNPIVVPDEIANTLKEQMEGGNIILIKPQRLEKGDRVLIKDGPLKDFYGIFEREIKGPDRVMILLEAINYRLEIDSCLVKKI